MRYFFTALISLVLPSWSSAQVTEPRVGPQIERLNYREVGLVLLHGKWGRPPAPLASKFAELGFQVISPEMGWSHANEYRITYTESLAKVYQEIEKLRSGGVKKVVIGGQSFGANGALAYASLYDNIDGLILFAPGHNPDIDKNRDLGKLREAKSLIEKSSMDQVIEFVDNNDGGRTRVLKVPVAAYVSYFDPEGLAAMPVTAKQLKKPVPVVVFMGRSDYVTTKGPGYFFNRLPKHPGSRYQVSSAGHRDVPATSYEETLNWLETFIMGNK